MQVTPGPPSTTDGPDLPPETGTGRETRNGTATSTALGRISHLNENLLNSYVFIYIVFIWQSSLTFISLVVTHEFNPQLVKKARKLLYNPSCPWGEDPELFSSDPTLIWNEKKYIFIY